jgi:hypothetical protein
MSDKISLGSAEMDIQELLRTRLLLQANSGGGKSWAIRRCSEELFGRVPLFIIDPEGEFSTLREKFDFVHVGPGGETPADPNSAGIVAEKLLELKVSAVLDIYELKPPDRHRWVRAFLEALIDAPKSLWHPRMVVVDEAHVFCPEKGMGDSEASGAMIDLATRGRKRGLCPIFATQRLSKLAKNATAELLNRLVGPTFEDLDLDRAADLLSVGRGSREDFFREMKTLPSGVFYGLGRAISKERLRIEIGAVQTTHPEMGATGYVHAPTPTPEKIKALLDKLEGIPKIAEERARTEDTLRAEIVKLRAELAAKPKVIEGPGSGVAAERVEVAVIKGSELARLDMAFEKMERFAVKFESVSGVLRAFIESLRNEVKRIEKGIKGPAIKPVVLEGPDDEDEEREELPQIKDVPDPDKATENNELKGVHKALLKALCDFKKIGIQIVPRSMLAGWLDVDPDGGSFLNTIGKLKGWGLINTYDTENGEKGQKLTEEGLRQAPVSELEATPEGVFSRVRLIVNNSQKAMLDIFKEKYPTWVSREELANALGLQVSGSFKDNLSGLCKKMMVEGRFGDKNQMTHAKLADWTIMATVVAN